MKCYISFQELDALGQALSTRYIQQSAVKDITCFDIEGFITEGLGLKICYESFAEQDQSKVGFLSDGIRPLWVWRNGTRTAVRFPINTIVIEKALQKDGEGGRKRFTLAHEAGHYILKLHCPLQAACFHTDFDNEANYSKSELQKMFSLEESFANRIAAALLMPTLLVEQTLALHNGGQDIFCYNNEVFSQQQKLSLSRMADDLGVSYSALLIRLRDLGRLTNKPIEEYLSSTIMPERQKGAFA